MQRQGEFGKQVNSNIGKDLQKEEHPPKELMYVPPNTR